MKKLLKTLLFGAIVLSLALVGMPAAGQAPATASSLPPDVAARAQLLADNLAEQGFEVLMGELVLYTNDFCPESYLEMETCYGNNPAAPYVLVSLPPWDKEFIDPATDTAFSSAVRAPYRLDPREAIIVLGDMPPEAEYFGLQSYLVTRQGQFDKHAFLYNFVYTNFTPTYAAKFFTPLPQNHQRNILFASLGNSINHVVIEQQSTSSWNQEKAFVISPDQVMEAAARTALEAAGMAEQDVLTEQIPSFVDLGLNRPAEDFITVIRYAMPADGGAPGTPSDTWRHTLPMAVLRVRDTQPGRQAVPFDPVPIESRSWASELPLQPDLNGLASAVAARWGQPGALAQARKMLVMQQPPFNLVGPSCIPIGQNCLADTQDSSYQYSYPLPVKDNLVYAIIGTLGTETGNASYVGFGLTASLRLLGFDNLSDADLKGTAAAYQAQVNNTGKFFLYYLARDCSQLDALTDGHCLEIAVKDIPACADPTYATCDKLTVSLRDYIFPGTRRGPNDLYKLTTIVLPLAMPAP